MSNENNDSGQAASTQSSEQATPTQNSEQAAPRRPVQPDPDLMYPLHKAYDGKPENKGENNGIEAIQRGSIERKQDSEQKSQESK